MIPRSAITHWNKQVPWEDIANVEQDLIITRALTDIWQRLDEKITCRIRIDRDLKYIEQDQRQQVIEFLTTASGKLMEIFTPYSLKYSKK